MHSAVPMHETVSQPSVARRRIEVRGIVQGVGFRPFVFRLASSLGLSGFVKNTSEGALIEVEGAEDALNRFLAEIVTELPPLAQIEDLVVGELKPSQETGFEIQNSLEEADKFALVSPDVGTCEDCRRELTDTTNRRFGYPFINCTNCGPRYTIVRDVPYDRATTTMAGFRMCAACQAEYDAPSNRRFHAQPNACADCGPGIALVRNDGPESFDRLAYFSGSIGRQIILEVRQLLREGAILAVKGMGGFNLVCDATNDSAVRRLRERKRRNDKPLALLAPDLIQIENFCIVSDADRKSLLGARRPIVILRGRAGAKISQSVAPDSHTLGVMLPSTPLHYLLFHDHPNESPEFTALVMTSGNISEEPIVSHNEEIAQLRPIADWFLLHNREIHTRVDDSVVRVFDGKERTLRRSRGYAPHPIDLGTSSMEILGCGGELKNTFCLTKGGYAFLSQHIGDLENFETLVFFQETLDQIKKLFRVAPRAVAYDLHPLYMSSKFARSLDVEKKVGVQHHHAHIASCMVENGLRDKLIGVAFDGTGYGSDDQIWGGEFLIADFAGFERCAHFRYIPLAGGDAAVRQPWRSALGWLRETFGENGIPMDLSSWKRIPSEKLAIVQQMMSRGVNTVQTSSCGRLFDAVASILGLRQETSFEGQAAIQLEMNTLDGIEERYPFEIGLGSPWQIDFRPTIETIVRDVQQNIERGAIASKFHNTVAAAIVAGCERIRKQEKLNRVCLSGGAFQNMYLLTRSVATLRSCGFDVYLHSKVPPNDGGISLGQVAIANELLRRGD